MLAFIALALLVGLVEGEPGCHWDALAPIFLQQEDEGARAWTFTLGQPSTVPDVLGLEHICLYMLIYKHICLLAPL